MSFINSTELNLNMTTSEVLNSPALSYYSSFGRLSRIKIKIYGMQPADNLQIDYVNWENIESPFSDFPFKERKKLSNLIRVNTNVYWEMALFDHERYSSILPLQLV